MAVVQIMKKDYPSAINLFMFKLPTDIAAIMGKTAIAGPSGPASRIQHCNGTSSNIAIRYDSVAGRNRAAERFLASENYRITNASVAIGRVSTPASHCWLELWSVTGSLPATVLATSNKYTIASLPSVGNPIPYKGFTFSTTPAVASGVNYALAIAGNNGLVSSSKYILGLRSAHPSVYPSGHYVEQTREGTWIKGVGAGFDIDMGFRLYGEPTPYEDFTTYTESDPGNDIDVSVTNLSFTNMERATNTFIQKDFTASYFNGDFTFKYEFNVTGRVGSGHMVFGITDKHGTFADQIGSDCTGIAIIFNTNDDLNLRSYEEGNLVGNVTQSGTGQLNTHYYCVLERIYDSGGGDSKYILTQATTAYEGPIIMTASVFLVQKNLRYLSPLTTQENNSGDLSGYIKNLDIGDAP